MEIIHVSRTSENAVVQNGDSESSSHPKQIIPTQKEDSRLFRYGFKDSAWPQKSVSRFLLLWASE